MRALILHQSSLTANYSYRIFYRSSASKDVNPLVMSTSIRYIPPGDTL